MKQVCPHYKNGYCISPVLDNPSDAVVTPDRCFKMFKTCRYFVDKKDNEKEEKEGLSKFDNKKIEQEVKFYPEVNLVGELDSGCDFFESMRMNNGLIVYCKILGRVLPESHAERCSKYWETCPLRK